MPTFILGAGFNLDATAAAGPVYGESMYVGRYRIECGYPSVQELLKRCFELEKLPPGQSVEDLFEESLARRAMGPTQKLADCLFEADNYIAGPLARAKNANCYQKLFESFPGSDFLTFNYDSLVETFLFHFGRWRPDDGFGVPVQVVPNRVSPANHHRVSRQRVLHLHGSLCIRTVDHQVHHNPGSGLAELTMLDRPLYLFDSASIAGNFQGYGREPGLDLPQDQIIAPVPDKAGALARRFICETYQQAESLLKESTLAIAIGYSFSLHDRASYEPLLAALGQSQDKALLVVAPDAEEIAGSLRRFTGNSLAVTAHSATFREWADAGFSGVG